jgi:PEP-CTERM motif
MMRKVIFTTIATLATAVLFTTTTANAATYDFTFQSNDAELMATGQFTVNAASEVTGVSGAVSGLTNQTISGVAANPSFPGSSYSPDGSFIFDNLYASTGNAFDYSGLLFVTAGNPGGYWNLWSTAPGDYSLYESAGSYNYPIQEVGTLSVAAATPEPSTWAMLALGFAALCFVGRRQRTPRLALALG